MSKENIYGESVQTPFEEEFDPSQDDEGRVMRLPQTLGCLLLIASIATTVSVVSCHEVMKEKGNSKAQPVKTEQVQEAQEEKVMPQKVSRKINNFFQDSSFTYSQAIRQNSR